MLVASDAPDRTWWRRSSGWIRFSGRRLGILQALLLAPALWDRRPARLAALAGRLKGPFVKLGQLASLRVDVLSPADRGALLTLRSQVPALPFSEVRSVLEAELGSLGDRFEAIDPSPLGSASIAQAHRARLRDGREVVVKIQYPWLAGSCRADLRLLRIALRRGLDLAPDTFEAFARSYRRELDFRNEARAATTIAENLRDDAQVVVPRVVASASTARVLTVEHVPAIPIDDAGALASRGVSRAELLEVVARAYARQIFVDGLFHADPHPGNLFVVDEAGMDTRPRVLFVDFGLAEALDPDLRDELRRGILALVQQDVPGFVAGMARMRMIAPGHEPAVERAVEAMFGRIRGEGSALALSGPRILGLKDEAKALLYETPGLALPPELLLYARTVSYLFQLGQELAPEVDLMKLVVPYLLRFLAEKR